MERPDPKLLNGQAALLWFQVQEMLTWLMLGYMPAFAAPPPHLSSQGLTKGHPDHPMPQQAGWQEIDKEKLQIIKVRLDACFKMMSKVLPDLKAMELTETLETARPEVDPALLASRLRGIMALEQASEAPHGGRLQ